MNDRIKQLRLSLGLSQGDFAKTINVSRNFISLIETGERNLSDRTISDICRVHGVMEAWLRTGKEPMYQKRSRQEEIDDFFKDICGTGDFRELFVSALAKLTVDEWEIIEKLVLSCANEQNEPTLTAEQLYEK